MNNKELENKVNSYTHELIMEKGYVCSVDILLKLEYISKKDYDAWRLGKVEYLEKVCKVNLSKLSMVNKIIRKNSIKRNLDKSWTAYNKYSKGPKKRLIFSKSGDNQIESFYATHFLDKRRISELKIEKQLKNSSATETMINKQETNLLHDENKIATTT